MRIVLCLLIFFLAGSAAAAQDLVKVFAGFQNLNVANQNLPGGNISADVRLFWHQAWRVGGVFDGSYQYDTNKRLNRYQFLGGPQVSYAFDEKRLSVFGRALFGLTRFDSRTYAPDFTRLTVSAGGGLDVHYGRFFVRPVQFDFQWIDERPVRYTRFGSGVGVRF